MELPDQLNYTHMIQSGRKSLDCCRSFDSTNVRFSVNVTEKCLIYKVTATCCTMYWNLNSIAVGLCSMHVCNFTTLKCVLLLLFLCIYFFSVILVDLLLKKATIFKFAKQVSSFSFYI